MEDLQAYRIALRRPNTAKPYAGALFRRDKPAFSGRSSRRGYLPVWIKSSCDGVSIALPAQSWGAMTIVAIISKLRQRSRSDTILTGTCGYHAVLDAIFDAFKIVQHTVKAACCTCRAVKTGCATISSGAGCRARKNFFRDFVDLSQVHLRHFVTVCICERTSSDNLIGQYFKISSLLWK